MKYIFFLSGLLMSSFLSQSQSQWSGTGPIYYNGGNVGIGTSNPSNLFVVSGAIPSAGGTLSVIRTTGSNNGYGLALDASGTGNNNFGFQVNGSSKAVMSWDNSRNFLGWANFNYSANDFSMRLNSDGSFTYNNGSTGNELFRISENGKVGIGTTSPRGLFDVGGNGDIYLSNSPNTGTAQSLFLPGHIFLAPYNGGNVSYLQARRQDNSGSTQLQIRTYNSGSHVDAMLINSNGNVGIGTVNTQAKLTVNGDILSSKVKVTQSGWADYVFHATYRLRPLSEVEQYIQQYHHLPEVPSAAEVEKNGIDLGDNQATLLKKIEELTLYIIEQNKRLSALEKKLPAHK